MADLDVACRCVLDLLPALKPEYAAIVERVDLGGVPVPQAVVHRAVLDVLRAGRRRGWEGEERVWVGPPWRQEGRSNGATKAPRKQAKARIKDELSTQSALRATRFLHNRCLDE